MRISDWSSDVCSFRSDDRRDVQRSADVEAGFADRARDAADVGSGIALGIAGIGAYALERFEDDAAVEQHIVERRIAAGDIDAAIGRGIDAVIGGGRERVVIVDRSEEHTSELQSLMRIS